MNKIVIEKGQKYGKLTVIREIQKVILPSGQSNRLIECTCECGKKKNIRLLHLVRLRTISCGCLKRGKVPDKNLNSPLRKVYRQMKNRCTENYQDRHLYFDKGIKVCKQWNENWFSFKEWSENNGYVKGLHIDRINNKKGYSPSNCRFTNSEVNANNRDNTLFVLYNGKKEPFLPLMRKLKMLNKMCTIRGRIKRGWNNQEAIDTPIRTGNYKNNYTTIHKYSKIF